MSDNHNITPIENSEQNPTSMRYAINAKCWDCIYDPAAPGNWRQQVTACTQTDCPLFKLRPVSGSKKYLVDP